MHSRVLENLIMVLYEQAEVEIKNGDYQQTVITLEKLMGYLEDRQDHPLYGGALRLYGEMNRRLGKYHPALRYAQNALSIDEKNRDKKAIVQTKSLLGNIYFQFCKYPEAADAWEEALQVIAPHDEFDIGDLKPSIYLKLGAVLLFLSKYRQARSNFIKGLTSSRNYKDYHLLGLFHVGIGATYHAENRFSMAQQIYYRALKVGRKSKDKKLLGLILHSLGDLFTKKGWIDRAKLNYEKSLEFSREVGDFLTEAATLRELGRLYLKLEPEKTPDYINQSFDILIDNISTESRSQCERLMGKNFYQMALYHFKKREQQQAKKFLVEAAEIFHKFKMEKEIRRANQLYREVTDGVTAQPPTFNPHQILSTKLGIG